MRLRRLVLIPSFVPKAKYQKSSFAMLVFLILLLRRSLPSSVLSALMITTPALLATRVKIRHLLTGYMPICKVKGFVAGLGRKTGTLVIKFDLVLKNPFACMISCCWYSQRIQLQVIGLLTK